MNKLSKAMVTGLLLLCCAGLAHEAHGAKAHSERASRAPASTQATPSFQVVDPIHDFGEALEGSEVVHEFRIRNTGRGPLQIDQVRPG